MTSKADQLERRARGQTRAAGRWFVLMARVGYVAKGVVYVLIGGIAARAAFGADEPEGSIGALAELFSAPLGGVLVAVIAAGLLAFGVWRLARGIANPERDGRGTRLASVGSGLVHLFLGVAAVKLLFNGGRHTDGGEDHWVAMALRAPLGRYLVLAVALGILGNGLRRLYRAAVTKLDDDLSLHELGPRLRTWTIRVSRVGMAARGIVFVLIGGFLGVAALRREPGRTKGIAESLQEMLQQPYGRWLLTATAIGLMAYGVYQFILARYRRVGTG